MFSAAFNAATFDAVASILDVTSALIFCDIRRLSIVPERLFLFAANTPVFFSNLEETSDM